MTIAEQVNQLLGQLKVQVRMALDSSEIKISELRATVEVLENENTALRKECQRLKNAGLGIWAEEEFEPKS